jgi:hypothetical protein
MMMGEPVAGLATPTGGVPETTPTADTSDVESGPDMIGPPSVPEMIGVESDPETSEVDSPDMVQPESDPEMTDGEADPETTDETTEPTDDMMEPTDGEAAPETTDETTEPEVEVDEPPGAAPLSFANDIWPLWSMERDPVFVYRGMGSYSGCTDSGVCHGGQSAGGQLSMADRETAYQQMIDTPSVSSLCAGTQRVAVGDPDNSCLILFYVGRLGKEDLAWVDDSEIELMREWIRQGALP